jgi:hypothetical protein
MDSRFVHMQDCTGSIPRPNAPLKASVAFIAARIVGNF